MHMSVSEAKVRRCETSALCACREQAHRLRRQAYQLAARTAKDPRTCVRALRYGSQALRSAADQVLVEEAARELGIRLPSP